MVTTQDIIDDIARSVNAYPGPTTRLIRELRIRADTLRRWRTGNTNNRYRPPTMADAARVREAVRRLLLRALAQLDDPGAVAETWTRRGTRPGERHGNAIPKRLRKPKDAAETGIPEEST